MRERKKESVESTREKRVGRRDRERVREREREGGREEREEKERDRERQRERDRETERQEREPASARVPPKRERKMSLCRHRSRVIFSSPRLRSMEVAAWCTPVGSRLSTVLATMIVS